MDLRHHLRENELTFSSPPSSSPSSSSSSPSPPPQSPPLTIITPSTNSDETSHNLDNHSSQVASTTTTTSSSSSSSSTTPPSPIQSNSKYLNKRPFPILNPERARALSDPPKPLPALHPFVAKQRSEESELFDLVNQLAIAASSPRMSSRRSFLLSRSNSPRRGSSFEARGALDLKSGFSQRDFRANSSEGDGSSLLGALLLPDLGLKDNEPKPEIQVSTPHLNRCDWLLEAERRDLAAQMLHIHSPTPHYPITANPLRLVTPTTPLLSKLTTHTTAAPLIGRNRSIHGNYSHIYSPMVKRPGAPSPSSMRVLPPPSSPSMGGRRRSMFARSPSRGTTSEMMNTFAAGITELVTSPRSSFSSRPMSSMDYPRASVPSFHQGAYSSSFLSVPGSRPFTPATSRPSVESEKNALSLFLSAYSSPRSSTRRLSEDSDFHFSGMSSPSTSSPCSSRAPSPALRPRSAPPHLTHRTSFDSSSSLSHSVDGPRKVRAAQGRSKARSDKSRRRKANKGAKQSSLMKSRTSGPRSVPVLRTNPHSAALTGVSIRSRLRSTLQTEMEQLEAEFNAQDPTCRRSVSRSPIRRAFPA